jgi:hypothetical protein
VPHLAPETALYTDACNTGFGAVWEAQWLHGQWSESQLTEASRKVNLSMPYLEMLAVALALSTFGQHMRGLRITVRSDSETAVAAMHGGACRDPNLMRLIRTILWLAATHQFAIRCIHIAGKQNVAADCLSRGLVQEFRRSFPLHDSSPTPVTPLPTLIW